MEGDFYENKVFIVVGLILFCIFFGLCLLNHMENYEEIYYSKIDNNKIEKLSTNDETKYEYTLDVYNKSGKKKELKFKTRRELREKAYIRFSVRTMGIYSWEEVEFKNIPNRAKEKLKQ